MSNRLRAWLSAAAFWAVVAGGASAEGQGAQEYERIDAHALAAPPEAERSVEGLADYLVSGSIGERERCRAIFRWMTDRIEYDVERLRAHRIDSMAPEDVLRARRSVCSGYAELFSSLAAAMGIESVVIAGNAKGAGYEVGSRIPGPTDHAWNAVRIDGLWRLIDCTWGAGMITPELSFERRFRSYYFLAPPEELIYTHFPSDPRWQLLPEPVTLDEFERMVHMRETAFSLGLRALDPEEGWLGAGEDGALSVRIPRGVHLAAALVRDGKDLDASIVWIQEGDETASIACIFPEAGRYRLDLYARKDGDPAGRYALAMSYAIDAGAGAGDRRRFPIQFDRYGSSGAELFAPRGGVLEAGAEIRFSIRVPGARSVAVVIGDDFHDLRPSGDLFEGVVAARRGKMGIFAAFAEGSSYEEILEYEAR